VRYADITYVIDRIRSVLIESDLSNEDEYHIYQLGNLVHFPIAQIEQKESKVDLSPKDKSSNVRDFLPLIGRVLAAG
jgi:hypothetical protein